MIKMRECDQLKQMYRRLRRKGRIHFYKESIKFSFWRLPFTWAAVFPLIRVCARFPAQGRSLVSIYFFSLAHTCSRSRFHIKSGTWWTGSVPFWQAHSLQFTVHSSQFTSLGGLLWINQDRWSEKVEWPRWHTATMSLMFCQTVRGNGPLRYLL